MVDDANGNCQMSIELSLNNDAMETCIRCMGDFQKEGLTVQNPFCPTTVYLTKLLIFKTIHFSSLKNLHHRCFRDIIVSPCEENSCFENTLNIKMCDIREDKIYGFSGIPNRKCTQC